jgi:DNA-binding NarL/FixJ family response regulator
MRLEPLYQQEKEKLQREVKQLTQREIAANLLNKGMEIQEIAEVTGLSPEEVTKLTTNNSHEK